MEGRCLDALGCGGYLLLAATEAQGTCLAVAPRVELTRVTDCESVRGTACEGCDLLVCDGLHGARFGCVGTLAVAELAVCVAPPRVDV